MFDGDRTGIREVPDERERDTPQGERESTMKTRLVSLATYTTQSAQESSDTEDTGDSTLPRRRQVIIRTDARGVVGITNPKPPQVGWELVET
jgi:hypothetical protein